MERTFTRRRALRDGAALGGTLLLAPVLAACGEDNGSSAGTSKGGPDVTSDLVVVATFGGEIDEIRKEIWYTPYTAEFGARVQIVPWDVARFIKMTEAGRVQWDSIDTDGFTLVDLARRDLLEKLPAWVTRSDVVDPEWRDYAAGGYAYSFNVGYRTDRVGDAGAPQGWADFFDTAKYPGKRTFPKTIYPGTVEAALIADGVARDALYPLDFERAFRKLDTVRDDLLFYESYGQGAQFLVQGSATMGALPNGRIGRLTKGGRPIDIVWNEALLFPWSGWPVPKEAPHADAMFALVDLMAQPKYQADHARRALYGPTNTTALDMLDDETLELLPNSPDHLELVIETDTQALADVDAEYIEKFFAWVGG